MKWGSWHWVFLKICVRKIKREKRNEEILNWVVLKIVSVPTCQYVKIFKKLNFEYPNSWMANVWTSKEFDALKSPKGAIWNIEYVWQSLKYRSLDFGVEFNKLINKSYLSNIFETLSKMRLNSFWIFGLWKDFQQFVIRQKVESWEWCSFCFKVLTQSFLDLCVVKRN